ncbi:hypothetical protein [Kyrpidia spormannii]|uniref:Uncharacterized protein n=1 Tax=Kyrpidia spormannii TaxID=2055160 RepID=A0A6F9EIM7_9BACL|nr:hypothetical protein [Kyrpidia spormannii]CAB3396338.1 conserved protein of unknown function [Kyrpidia spormannii]
MDERSILAYFRSFERACHAANTLRQRGFSEVQLASVSSFPEGPAPLHHTTISGHIPSLANLTLGNGVIDRDESPLAAVHPSASGMADQEDPDAIGTNWLVTAVVPDNETEGVLNLLRSFWAKV